jgi:hypothetical protein
MRTPATAEFRLRLDFKAASLLAINQMLVSHLVRLDLRCASKLTERFSRKHNTLSEGLVQDPSEMMFCRFCGRLRYPASLLGAVRQRPPPGLRDPHPRDLDRATTTSPSARTCAPRLYEKLRVFQARSAIS